MDQFIGEIRIFAGNFAPRGWAFCNGQLMPVSTNSALFSILGVQYGGDGRTSFALPNLMGRAAIHQGHGPGLSNYEIGQQVGISTVTLLQNQIPNHSHQVNCRTEDGDTNDPSGAVWADVPALRGTPVSYGDSIDTTMSPLAIQPAGGSLPHNNMQPYVGMSFIIALEGEFPSRS